MRSAGSHCLRVIRNHAAWLRQIVRALHSNGANWFEAKELPNDVDVLFVSHLLTEAHAGQADDFYFGDLPSKLIEQGLSVVIVLINHTVHSGASLVGKLDTSIVPRLILSGSLGILDELILHRRLKKESLQLSKLARMEPPGLKRKILARASEEARANTTRTTLRLGKQISALVAKLKPKAVIVTHEGHAWERVAFAAARSSHANVRCIGYQHAALFRLQHAIRRQLEPKYNPDQILTAGTVAKAQLVCEPSLTGISISVLGSSRAKRVDETRLICHQRNVSQSESAGMSACLVVPEGISSECHLLFEFALECANLCPELQFIWRLHPLMAYKRLVAQNPKLRDLPENVVLSTSSLSDDISRSQWVLYRGSTAVIQAVAAGLQPIYLMLHDEMTIDPLFEIGDSRIKVETAESFRQDIKKMVNLSPTRSGEEASSMKKYCHNFYLPFDYGLISRIVSG